MTAATPPQRSPLQFAAGALTVALAVFSRYHLVVPFLLAWAIWGGMQRSKRPERRWVAAAFAAPAASLVWLIAAALLELRALALGQIAILAGALLWLFLRPGKGPLWFQIGYHAVRIAVVAFALFQTPLTGMPVLRIDVADLYFHAATIVASVLALRRPLAPS